MKIALVQMSMGKEISENLDKSLKYCDMAENCDLVFFPEIQLTPFFPQYHNICVDHYCIDMDNDALVRLCQKAREHRYYLSPNVYLESEGARYRYFSLDLPGRKNPRYCKNGPHRTE